MKVLTATLILVFASVFNASAQLDVSINPIFAIFESYQISVEHTLRDSWSVGVDGSFSKELYTNGEGGRYAFLTGRHYFFPNKKSNRLYVNVFAGLIHSTTYESFYDEFDWSSYETVEHKQNFGYGFSAGYKFISNKNIIFDVAAGVGRGREVFPHFKINLGYRFNYKAS